jgi:undecaprenyl phosphate-alpha-L-ara4N flippase subunit ArnE
MGVDLPPPEAVHAAAAQPNRAIGFIALAVMAASVLFAVAGQYTLKTAMDKVGAIQAVDVKEPLQTIARVAREPRVWLGLALFGISAAFYLIVLSRIPLSVAYPLAGMQYLIVVGVSQFVLHEEVPPLRWFGVAVIMLGILSIGLSFRRVTG